MLLYVFKKLNLYVKDIHDLRQNFVAIYEDVVNRNLFVIDLDDLGVDVVGIYEDAIIRNPSVQGEAHRSVVGVFLSSHAAVAVADNIVLHEGEVVLRGIVDGHGEHELHTLFVAFGEQHPVGNAALLRECRRVQLFSSLDSTVGLLHESAEALDVGNSHRRLAGRPAELVVASSQFVPELVHFNAVPSSFIE